MSKIFENKSSSISLIDFPLPTSSRFFSITDPTFERIASKRWLDVSFFLFHFAKKRLISHIHAISYSFSRFLLHTQCNTCLMTKSTTFFEALQKAENLDLRDGRGKRHNLSLILLEFVLGLLCHRDGNLSSIWRHMKPHHLELVEEL